MMRSLSNDLSARARFLAERDGRSIYLQGIAVALEVELPEFTIHIDPPGTLHVETWPPFVQSLYMEAPNGSILCTSPDEVLQGVIDVLKKHMILDDLASV